MNQTSLDRPNGTKKGQKRLPELDLSKSATEKPATVTNNQFQAHIDRAEVIARYGEAFKKFDWLFYIVVAFLLFILSLLASYLLGPIVSGICTLIGTAALILLKKKAG